MEKEKEYVVHLTTDQLRDLISEQVTKSIKPYFSELASTRREETDIISVSEGAALLGLKTVTVYSKKAKRELPGLIKRGNRLYFSKRILLEYLNSGKIKTAKEIIAEAEQELNEGRLKR